MTTKQAAALLMQWDNIAIITHRRPDGDTVGCAAALCEGLRSIGKTAYIVPNKGITPRYMPYVEKYLCTADPVGSADKIVSVDTASKRLYPVELVPLADITDLAIDHHGTNSMYARNTCLDASLAACGEMVYEILLLLCGEITPEMAAPLYMAISTDTGCFRYSNTSENTLRCAADLYAKGIDAYAINKVMFSTKSIPRLRLESMLVEGMELYGEGKVVIMTLTRAMMDELGLTEDDIDDISGFPRLVEGTRVGIMVRELDDNTSKVSVRTGGNPSAAEICEKLGGGGHPGAGGAEASVDYITLKYKLLEAMGLKCQAE